MVSYTEEDIKKQKEFIEELKKLIKDLEELYELLEMETVSNKARVKGSIQTEIIATAKKVYELVEKYKESFD